MRSNYKLKLNMNEVTMKNPNKHIHVIAIFVILYAVSTIFLSEDIMFIINEAISPILSIAALLLLLAAYRHTTQYKAYVLCMAIATTMYLLGDITWIHHEIKVSTDVPVSHISSAFYITNSIFVNLAIMALIARLYKKWDMFRTTVDIFVIGIFTSYIAWSGFFPSIKLTLSMDSENIYNLIIILEVFIDLLLLTEIFVIQNSDRSYFRTRCGKNQFAGFLIWSVADLIKWYMAIFNNYYTENIVELLWPISLCIVAKGIYDMEVTALPKAVFEEPLYDRGRIKSITVPIFLLFSVALIFKPMLEFIIFFVMLIFFRVALARYIVIYEENYNLAFKYKEVNSALSVKIDDINNFNLNLEKNVAERTRELEIKNQELYSSANIDLLTKIPNRRNFMNKLDNMIEAAGKNKYFAILFIDLDRFKAINDWNGHESGDIVLENTAFKIMNMLEDGDFLARLGGDEFVVMLENIKSIESTLDRANAIVEEFRKPFSIGGKNVICTISVGISIYPINSKRRTELMKFADIALYRAKTQGKNMAVLYDKDMKKEESRKLEIESRINEGFGKGEFYLDYQPQIDIDSEKMVGVEALVRWNNSELGIIGPGEFIGIAEDNGLIIEIGEFVISEVFKAIKYLNEKYDTNMTMAINFSPKQFYSSNLTDIISAMVQKYDVNPSWIEVEITENLSIRNEETVFAKLEELKNIGVSVAMDDFGMGYSSFSYLKKYPIDKLKIARELIIGVADNPQDYKIIKSIVSMCKELGVLVIAEGAEKREQVDVLKQLGCDIIQGYYYSKPISLEEMEKIYFKL